MLSKKFNDLIALQGTTCLGLDQMKVQLAICPSLELFTPILEEQKKISILGFGWEPQRCPQRTVSLVGKNLVPWNCHMQILKSNWKKVNIRFYWLLVRPRTPPTSSFCSTSLSIQWVSSVCRVTLACSSLAIWFFGSLTELWADWSSFRKAFIL